MNRNTILIVLFAWAGLLTLAACSPGGSAGSAPPPPQEITLVATDIAYDATRIESAVGQPIRLTLDNQGALVHDFSIREISLTGEATATGATGEMMDHDMGVDMGANMGADMAHDMGHGDDAPAVHVAAPSGEAAGVEFTPAAPGEYEYYCTVSGHREAGMVGVLVVN
ncbi:MAG: hypothetical protein KJ046_07830 [Anaerolineae bacterium]|nr:hypothetical protein [Anaerolineae bacterium]